MQPLLQKTKKQGLQIYLEFFIIKQEKNQEIRPVSYIKELSLCTTTWKSQGKRDLIEPLHTLKVDIFAEQL